MRFMIIRKADQDSEANVMPSEQLLADMGNYNEALAKAGMLRAGEGLQPSAKGARIKFKKGKPIVTDGPFAETKELIAGFTIIEARSKEEALEWVKRWPTLDGDGEAELELRQVFEADDFGAEFTPELREQEERLRLQAAAQGVARPMPPVTPHLTVRGAKDAIAFYERAFGAKDLGRVDAPDGKRLLHCYLEINGGAVMMVDEFPEHGGSLGDGPVGVTIHLAVDDADRWWKRALDAGCTVEMPIGDQFWGDRYGAVRDPFGHSWGIGSPIRK